MSLSIEDIKRLNSQFSPHNIDKNTGKTRVLQGVLSKADIVNVSANPNALRALPNKFNNELPEVVKATDQQASGRCWLFASLNIMRHKLINKYKLPPDFELSQTYLFKYDKLEKCNYALEVVYDLIAKQGKDPGSLDVLGLVPSMIGDGGNWGMFVRLVSKYGVVPKEVYPDNQQASHTNNMNAMLYVTIMKTLGVVHKNMSLGDFKKYKSNVMSECHRIITLCLGNSPETFDWYVQDAKRKHTIKHETYTPKTFYAKVVKPLVDVRKYVLMCNFPIENYNTWLCAQYSGNILEPGDSLVNNLTNAAYNVDAQVLKDAAFKAIKSETGVYFACDYNQYRLNRGVVLDRNASNLRDIFDVDFHMPKTTGYLTHTNVPNHAMMLAGCQKEKDGKYSRWKVENSHGEKTNNQGFLVMSDTWFEDYVICIAVPKSCLPEKLRGALKSSPSLKTTKVKYLPWYSVFAKFA